MALMIEIEDPVEVGVCNAGHPRTEANTVYRGSGKQGKKYPCCRPCRNASVQRLRQRQRGEEVILPSFISRRSPYRQSEPPPASTKSLYSMLPPPMRVSLYAATREAKGDPIALRALRVASEQRAWSGLSEAFAAIVFIEADDQPGR